MMTAVEGTVLEEKISDETTIDIEVSEKEEDKPFVIEYNTDNLR